MTVNYTVYTIEAVTPTGERFMLPMYANDLEHAKGLAECEASELTGYEFAVDEIKTRLIEPRHA